MIHRQWGRLVKDVREDCTYYFNEYPFAKTCLRKVNGKGGESTTVLLADNTWIPSKRDILKVNSPDARKGWRNGCADDSREVLRTLWIDMSNTVGHNEHKEFGKLHRNYNLEGDTMSYHDIYYSEFQGYKEVKDHFVADCNVARMSHGFDLREKDGVYSFGRDIHDGSKDSDGKYIGNHQVDVEYHQDGTIILKKAMLKDLAKNKYNMGSFLRWLPDSVHIYEHSKKMYLIYTPGENARSNADAVFSVWEWLGTNDIILYKDGSVEEEPSLIKRERGKTKTAEDKPLKEQLNEKHYREIAKARLETDLQVQLNTMYATFRGQPTSLYHIAIELFRPSIYGNGGPNEGLIRRLYVGRFIDKANREEHYELAGKIVGSDIPTSAIVGKLKNYV